VKIAVIGADPSRLAVVERIGRVVAE